MKEKSIIIIYGATGVGKTEQVLRLANSVSAEIINMDSGQCYTPLTIGTAKPDWKNESAPHHLFDIIDEPKENTVTEYRKQALVMCNTIWKRGNTPCFVGGSGFYLKSLFFPPIGIATDEKVVAKYCDGVATKDLWKRLHSIDSERAESINENDRYRITRALAVWYQTGKKPSQQFPKLELPAQKATVIWLYRDRSELYQRIDARVIEMLQNGWIAEVAALRGTKWEFFFFEKKLIGYDDIARYLSKNSNEQDEQELIAKIQKKTRNYAKRQITFWNMLKKSLSKINTVHKNNKSPITIHEFNLTTDNLDLYIKQLLS